MKFKNDYKLFFAKVFSLAMLAVYMHVSIQIPHNHDHEKEAKVSHDAITHLQDDCHNFIYHGTIAQNCNDHSHASEEKSACLQCHSFSIYKYIQPSFESTVSARSAIEFITDDSKEPYFVAWANAISPRGPPVLV